MGERNDSTKKLLIIGAKKFSTEIEELARLMLILLETHSNLRYRDEETI